MSCSALKRKYRDQLRAPLPADVEFLHLHGHAGGDRPAPGQPARATSCPPRCWPPSSPPSSRSQPDERGVVIDVDQSIDAIVDAVSFRHSTPTGELMTSAITCPLRDAARLAEPVAAGWQLILAAPRRHRADRRADHRGRSCTRSSALIFGGLDRRHRRGREPRRRPRSPSPTGFGSTAAGVGILIALGAMFAKLLADSGGADEIVDTIVGHASPRALPWAMALVGAIIGLPMFFEIGLVLLMPVIYLVARRSQLSLITVGIPALAGLSAMHGFVPPHPGPLTAIGPAQRRPRPHPGARRGRRDPDRSSWRARCSASSPARGSSSRRPDTVRRPDARLDRRRRATDARRSASRCSRCCCPSC